MFEKSMPDFTVNVPYWTLARFLVHYELFKRILSVPGCIVDIGVGSGGSTFAFAKMCKVFAPGDLSKHVHGFDTFAGFPSVAPQDGTGRYVYAGGLNYGKSAAMLADSSQNAGLPISFYKGDIEVTVPAWATANRDTQIALLNLDADLYQPTKAALRALYPLMAPGGIIIVDEYDLAEFPGEKQAVNEFFRDIYGRLPVIERFPWHHNPSGYIQL